jgi:hypothetical protein
VANISGNSGFPEDGDMDESARVNLDLLLAPPLIPVSVTAGGDTPGSTPDLGIQQEARPWLADVQGQRGFFGATVHHNGIIQELLPSESELPPSREETQRQFQSRQQVERRISTSSSEQSASGSHQQLQLLFGFGQAQHDLPVVGQVGIDAQSGGRRGQAPGEIEAQQMLEHAFQMRRLLRRFRPTRVSPEGLEDDPRTEDSLNVRSLPEALVVASNSLPEPPKSVAESSNFECNICLEMACEPVVTTCGHLFCWPCLHNCLQPKSPHQECPVCKGAIAPSVLTPIYGRGSESSTKISTSEAAASSIPLRPQAHRVESRRQRAERYVGERERARWVRMNELAAFHMRLERVPLSPGQRDADDLLDHAEQLVGVTELAASQQTLEVVPLFRMQREPDDLQALDQAVAQGRDDSNVGMSRMRDEMLSLGRAARILRESLSDTLQTRSSLIGELRDRVGAPPFGGRIPHLMSSSTEQTWQSREAARSVEAEQIRHVQMRHMRETPIRVAHEQNESTFHWTGVRARPVQRNNITNSYNVLFQQQPVQSQAVEVVPSFVGGDRSTGSPPVHEHAIEIRPSIPGTPASSASVDALATAQVVPRQVGAREVLVRERQRRYQENVSALLESRQDHSETFVDDGAAASEVGDMRLHGRKWRRLH